MAWIESHDDVWEHHKTIRLSRALGITKAQAVGHLHALWHFTLRNAWRDADLSAWGIEEIERVTFWEGEKGVFINALQEVGFLDGFTVHGWLERAGRLVGDRLRNEKRRRPYVKRTKTVRSLVATVPNPTLPYPTVPDPTKPEHLAAAPQPEQSAKPYQIPDKTKDPSGHLVIAYKLFKQIDREDRSWDKVHFARTKKSTKALIDVCGGYQPAFDCIADIASQMDGKGLDWTIETVLKHAHEWKRKRGIRRAELENNKSIFVGSKSVIGITPTHPRGGGLITSGSAFTGLRGLPHAQPDAPPSDGGATQGHGGAV